MPKRNMRDLIKKGTSSQTSKVTDSDSNEETEPQTTKRENSVSNKETNLQRNKQTDTGSNEETELQMKKQSGSSSTKPTEEQTNKLTESETNKQPKYLTLLRKETRLREDQFDDLTALARTLNRRRKGGERITENTLIRVAVDLLLKEADQLEGSTEEELREALDL